MPYFLSTAHRSDSKIAALRKKQKTNPNLSGEIEAEIEDLHTEQATVFDTAKMSDILDDLEQTFDMIALQLEKTQRGTCNTLTETSCYFL